MSIGIGIGIGLSGRAVPKNAYWFEKKAESIFGAANIIEQYIATPTSYAGWDARSGGHALSNTGAANFEAGMLGSKPAITATTAREACLRNSDLGTAIQCVVFVAAAPSLPDATNYEVLGGAGSSAATAGKMFVENGGTSLYTIADWSRYVDGVLTNVVPAAGGVHTFATQYASSALTGLEVGWNDVSNSPFAWRAPIAAIIALSSTVTAGQLAQYTAAAQAYCS